MIIDSHSHIYSSEFKNEYSDIIQRAKTAGVEKIILPNIDSSSINAMLRLSDEYPEICVPLIGIHPTSVNEDYDKELEIIEYWLNKRKFHGIGEIGLDYYWDQTFKDEQIIVLENQLNWCLKYDLPAVLHIRDAFDDIFDVVTPFCKKGLKGVFHSFTGTIEEAHQAMELGFYIGVNGLVTFKNAGIDKLVAQIPLEKLVVETDAPYLAPVPFRGKRNESSYVSYVIDKVSDLKQVPNADVCEITTANCKKLFNLGK
ncbi:TatD family hydrolase [Halosquirtibacter xylanolyticus]|uniref:TatD family hydrolase n=1 Tax=Halosquirtibacter xylanolyticus TaxID=3374599 RepID=UPI003749EA6B|nr:TatD family hydrolase [Prolixibacteraceae bacterium]